VVNAEKGYKNANGMRRAQFKIEVKFPV
jgi:hypothetical protein